MNHRLWAVHVLAATLVASGAAARADAHRPGCYAGATYRVGDVHRVYLTPHGCVWLLRPDSGHQSIGPQFRARRHGTTDGEALPRTPIGAAAAVCGFSTFNVWWPHFLVTSRRVAWGDGTGCHTLSEAAAVMWLGHFVYRPREGRRPARWVPVVDATSPPLRRGAAS